MRISRLIFFISWLWTLGFWTTTVLIPLLFIIVSASASSSALQILFEPDVLKVVRFTTWQAFWSMVLAAAIGLPLGLYLGRRNLKWISLICRIFLSLPYGVPSVVAAVAWIAWLGRSGILNRILGKVGLELDLAYSTSSVILAHVFFNIPLVALCVAQARERLAIEELEAAQTLGANGVSQLKCVIWPQVRWAFLSACSQVFVLCATSFILVLILGGGPPVQTLETEIYSRLRFGSFNFSEASAIALWELGLTLVPWSLVLWLHGRKSSLPRKERVSFQLNQDETHRFNWKGLGLIFLCVFWMVPYLVVFSRSGFSFILNSVWRSQLFEPLLVSFEIAGLTSLIALMTALMATYCLKTIQTKKNLSAGVGFLLAVPGGISVLVLSLGMWFAYGRWVDPFEGSLLLISTLQAALFFPLALRIFWPLIQGEQNRELEAARSLGATESQAFFLVEWPRWKGPILAAWSCLMGASLGEVGAVSLFYNEKLIPLPLLISRWMSQYRFEEAEFLGAILLVISFFTIVVSYSVVSPVSKGDFHG